MLYAGIPLTHFTPTQLFTNVGGESYASRPPVLFCQTTQPMSEESRLSTQKN